MRSVQIVAIAAAAALIGALLPWPYAYYQFLRVLVFGAALYCSLMVWGIEGERPYAIGALIAAVLFNPIVPVHLTREIWAPLDLLGAGLFGAFAYRARGSAAQNSIRK